MKRSTKKDILYCLIPVLLFLILVNILTQGTYLYGSQIDWSNQHIVIPDIFRSLFYSTKDLLPDFVFNIGNGTNIYNLAYYGFLSPITLISYLLPFIDMQTFITISTIITVLISTILLYIFLKHQKFSSEVSLISSVIFITSSCISFHSHRHVMFINYLPFLILGLFGVDKKLNNNKGWLLTLSVFLMIMTSFYFSVGGILTLIIYGYYKYLRSIKKVTIKSFLPSSVSLLTPIIIGIFLSGILTIPTFMTLISNREVTNTIITLKDLFVISSPSNYLYNSYGLGLTAILIPAVISFFKKKKENIFLIVSLILLATIPFFNYVLNGFMYINSKSLIPLLPLYILVIANFIKDIFDKKINYKILIPIIILVSLFIILSKYQTEVFIIEMIIILTTIFLYELTNKKGIIIIPLILLSFILCYSFNKEEYFVLKKYNEYQYTNNKELINLITENDKEIYRISNNYESNTNVNNIYSNIRYNTSTIYSSTSNKDNKTVYYETLKNNNPSRNNMLITSTENIFSLMLMNNKYLISRSSELHGYEKVYETDDGIRIYKNENVLPLAYATSNIMSYEEFSKLSTGSANEALLNVIVADTKSNHDYVTNVTKADIELKDIFNNLKPTIEKDKSLTFKVNKEEKIEYKLPKKYRNKILFISFKMNKNNNCKSNDQIITINNISNKLTCSSWKYHNKNFEFNYVLSEKNLNTLYITINKGTYNLKELEISYMDPAHIENVNSKIDSFEIDKQNTKGDIITGAIDVTKDGYFATSIPYDKGFIIKVDGNKVPYERINNGFLGFQITKGTHDIEIEYKVPYKKLGISITLVGLILYAIVTILEYKRKF